MTNITRETAAVVRGLIDRIPNVGNTVVKFSDEGHYVVAMHHDSEESSMDVAATAIAAIKVAHRSRGEYEQAESIDSKHLQMGDCLKVGENYTVVWFKI